MQNLIKLSMITHGGIWILFIFVRKYWLSQSLSLHPKTRFMNVRPITLLLSFLFLISFFACKKSETAAPSASDEFKFVTLQAQDTLLKVNDVTTITATATGTGLTYKWTASYGTFIGSGSTIQWTVCHADRFKITCEITDNSNHSDSRDVYISTHE
jgi:hypothetical protein